MGVNLLIEYDYVDRETRVI